MNPPTDIKPSTLWLKLQEKPAPSMLVDFPRKGTDGATLQVRIFAATQGQIEQCRLRALDNLVAKHKWDSEAQQQTIQREVIGDAVAREILCHVCHDPEPASEYNGQPTYTKVFPSPDALKELLPDEIAVLWSTYQMVQTQFGPMSSTMDDPAQVDAWIERLAEGGSAFPLALLDLPQRDSLTVSLAKRLASVSSLLVLHSESLPSALTSDLQTLPFDTFSSGAQRKEPPSEPPEEETSDNPVTLEMAQELVRKGRIE